MAKETGWSEEHILDMNICRAWMYRHALLVSYDANTKYLSTDDEKIELYDMFSKL